MISEQLFGVENDFRQAVECGCYADVERLVVAYCETAAVEIRRYTPGDVRASEIVVRVNQTLNWSRNMLYATRAAHADSLRVVPFLRKYLQGNLQPAVSAGVDL